MKIDFRWFIVLAFLLLAVSFFWGLWPEMEAVKENPLVAGRFVSNQTVRDPLQKAEIGKMAFKYECNSCHQHFESGGADRLIAEHENITLNHGANNQCLNCHHKTNREAFTTRLGDQIPFTDSKLLCAQCHGPKYRDWRTGVHGRPNGYWDAAQGISVKVTCVACHDPHSPKFKPIEPAPGPHNRLERLEQFQSVHGQVSEEARHG